MTYTYIAAHNLPVAVSLSLAPTLDPQSIVKDCRFGRNTQVGEQTRMEDCLLDDCAYVQPFCDLMSADIGKFTNIAAMVRINPGVRIGNGAVVGSNSVVTKDVPLYAIVGGVAAKMIRQRFPQAIAQALEATAWWDWDHDTLTERLPDFKDLRGFLAKYGP